MQVMLVLAAAFITWGCCDWCPEKQTAQPPPKLRVALKHECVGAWVPINNTFVTSDPAKMWNGVLVQLGSYEDIPDKFEYVRFSSGGNEVAKLTSGTFKWLNIVPGNVIPAPMNPIHVAVLMPPSGTPCSTVESCAGTAGCTVDPNHPTLDLTKCFRQEKIHMDMTVEAILTLWTRPHGYRVKAEAVSIDASHPAGVMSYEFQLDEEMQIEAYDSGGNMLAGFPLAPGKVDLVEVVQTGGVDHGGLHSPPWPR